MPSKMGILVDLRTMRTTLAGLIFLVTASVAMAQEARLKNITLSSTDEHMVVSMRVEGAFTPEMLASIQDGAQTEFTFLLRMYRDRRMWLDEKLAGINLTHSLMYDPDRKVYMIHRSWAQPPAVETQSLEAAQALMSQIERYAILSLDQMQRGEGYELRAKVELSRVTLPYYLRYVFYFVSLWDFETEWHSVFFLY